PVSGPSPGLPIGYGVFDSDADACGIPLISGNIWILPAAAYWWWLNAGTYQVYARAAVFRSSDGGLTWSKRREISYYDVPLMPPVTLDFMSPQVHVNPRTGFLYWATSGGAGFG